MAVEREAGRRPYWNQVVFVLTAGWIVIWGYRMILTPIYPIISAYFGGISNAQIGAITSSFFLGYVLMQIPSGLLVDRFGHRRVLIPGFSVFAAGATVVALSASLPMLYCGSALAGLGCGTFYGTAYSLTATYVPQERKSFATAIVNSGTAVGSGVSLVSSSFLIGRGILPWYVFPAIIAVLCLIMIAVFARFIRPALEMRGAAAALRAAVAADQVENAADARFRGSILRDLFRPHLIAAYVLYFSTLYSYNLIETWLPNFLETERGFSGGIVGIASSLVFFSAIPGALIWSRLADRIPERKIGLIIGLELAAAGMLLLIIKLTAAPMLVAGIIAYGFLGKLAVEPIIISWLTRFVSKKSVATSFGVFNFFGMSASVVAPFVTGALSDAFSSKVYGFYVAIAIVLLGTLQFFLVNRALSARAVRRANVIGSEPASIREEVHT
ncbi:major facilitator superfamily MFS_1 [Coriobacterium glomerans PW2]|uniref:Major facilitator superfamily MFS_1 n=1 Tax=Coriobacterium glomerans (strain ATCC 49209 / DSM 20642 / JCM 10262 / PW2) TaxID=700015 RepID=F2N961_CORGP|nr:MFS transporter [Coriobacterium glomerans]AEB07737.1 major facilitator superfamily MFS_1 [Coriobacterium glomerans PW2]